MAPEQESVARLRRTENRFALDVRDNRLLAETGLPLTARRARAPTSTRVMLTTTSAPAQSVTQEAASNGRVIAQTGTTDAQRGPTSRFQPRRRLLVAAATPHRMGPGS